MTTQLSFNLNHEAQAIADELQLPLRVVLAVVELFEAGNTVPFIARYRKEATGGMDEIALRFVQDAIEKAQALVSRKNTVLKTIGEQNELTDALRQKIIDCRDLATLEAFYLPFKPKRRTKATIARELGLQPLADLLLTQSNDIGSRNEVLDRFVSAEAGDRSAVLQGALDIIAEQWSEDADRRTWLLGSAAKEGLIHSKVKRGKKTQGAKFEQYFDYREPARKIPSHRLLAMLRGSAEGVLNVGLVLNDDFHLNRLKSQLLINPKFIFARELSATVEDCYSRLLLPATESALLKSLKQTADEQAIEVFGKNLEQLLMAAPAGPRVTMGIDPGFRTGCKVAIIDGTGKFIENAAIYPTPPKRDIAAAGETVLRLIQKHNVELIAIGNGTASRETDAFVGDLIKQYRLAVTKVMVSESGASIYSASELAAQEFPDLDVTVRGAISIARRLQDPLAELVKTDPKSIGVGQYQHDVNQTLLRKRLDQVVESCVNHVGVDLNMASAPLLSHVAGIGPKLAENIVQFRNQNGRFASRSQLTNVPKLGRKAFEQAAGFLRIRRGNEPLDNSAVHPERYNVVERMAKKLGADVRSLVGNASLSAKLNAADFVQGDVGLPTVVDILAELAKPGRDPRKEFRAVRFNEQVNAIDDLKPGLVLEGVVTNVTHFGAFVDLGVHQDGLIHISQLADTFVKDPNDIVAVGDVVKVKVLEIDIARKRISLTRKFR